MLPQITCASALPGKTGKHENHIFTQILYWLRTLQQLDCVARTVHQCAVFLKEQVAQLSQRPRDARVTLIRKLAKWNF